MPPRRRREPARPDRRPRRPHSLVSGNSPWVTRPRARPAPTRCCAQAAAAMPPARLWSPINGRQGQGRLYSRTSSLGQWSRPRRRSCGPSRPRSCCPPRRGRRSGAVLAQHPRPLIGAQSALGAEIAGHDLHRVERRLPQRREVRVGPLARVAVVAVVGRVAAAEVLVLAGFRELVEPDERLGQGRRVQADLPGQFRDGGRAVDRAPPGTSGGAAACGAAGRRRRNGRGSAGR